MDITVYCRSCAASNEITVDTLDAAEVADDGYYILIGAFKCCWCGRPHPIGTPVTVIETDPAT